MQDWLAHRARATPDREALVSAGSGNSWSYATLDETVEEMAGRLHALGVDEEDHLAAVLGTGVEAVCLVHAAMRLGTTLVPLSPEFTHPELSERFERAAVDAVVCNAGTEETVREATESVDLRLSVLTIDSADWSDATPLADAEPAPFTPTVWEREDVQLLLFTSGTTGRAKAVQLTMGNLLASATASGFRLGIDPADRWLLPLSLHHMGGIAPVLRSALYGTTAIIRESFDPGGTVDDIQRFDATCISLVPTMLRRMLAARGTLPDSLRFVLVGGAPTPEELVARCRDFSVPICPTYGMTETASQVATARHREAYETPETVGRPLLWTDVTVVDETGSQLGPGETGELVVSGPTVTPGYYDDHTTTGEAIGPHGLHTGDVGYQDEEGRLYVLNRLDDRILTGGENVDPAEVVDAIREHPEVSDVAVVGLPDEEWGEQVTALIVPEDEPVEMAELEPFLRERLAGFKLPRTIGFTEELPRTVSGTVEREAVRERLIEGESEEIARTGTSGRAATETGRGQRGVTAEAEAEATANGEASQDAPESADEPAPDTVEGEPETTDDEPTAALEPEMEPAGRLEPGEQEADEPPLEDDESSSSAGSIFEAGTTVAESGWESGEPIRERSEQDDADSTDTDSNEPESDEAESGGEKSGTEEAPSAEESGLAEESQSGAGTALGTDREAAESDGEGQEPAADERQRETEDRDEAEADDDAGA
ncbi:MAG: AMP-binding protein [Halolamina sp.]|uniref:AMP-binding protein n=1 Tax=Halolamina sp. TaxID=1940283 RepID=UPI002FC35E3E